MPQIDAITQYILALVPAVTAIMGMVVVVGIGIAKIKKALAGSEEKVEKMTKSHKELLKQNELLRDQNKVIREENKELKSAIVELNKKLTVADFLKDKKVI